MKKSIVLFTLFLFSSFNLYAQSNFLNIFDRFEMKFDHPQEDIFFEDLNDDNLEDILIQTKTPEKKRLLIFFQRGDGFSPSPSQILDFDGEAIIFDVGNVTGQYQGREIVYLTSSSLKYYYLEENFYNPESKKLTDISSIFLSPSPESPVRCKFIWDANDDKLDDIFIAELNNLTLFFGEKNGIFKKSQKIDLNPFFTTRSPFRFSLEDLEDPEHFSQKTITRVPVLYVDDFNGDKRKDIISIFKDEIKVFFQNEKNEFSIKPDFMINLYILTEKEKKKIPVPAFTVFATDLNNDGLIDIVVSKSEVQAMASLSKIYIYLNKKGNIDLTPDQILMYESAYGDPQILDINGDNHKDLIISEAKMGIFQLLKILITRKVTFENAIYLGQSGKYPESPAAKIKSKLRFDLEKLEESKGEIAYFSGDFNKDGIKDILKKIDEKNLLAIFLGQPKAKEEIYSKIASYEIKEELPLLVVIKDLNNDKVSDIIFDFRMDDKKKLIVFLSK